MSGEGYGWFLGQVRVVPEPKHGQSEMQYFSESQTFPNFSLSRFPLKDKILKKSLRLLRGWRSLFLLNLLQADKGQQTTYKGKLSLLFLSLGVHLDTRHSPGFSWKSRLFMEISIVSRE
jgi:hypothetical protein